MYDCFQHILLCSIYVFIYLITFITISFSNHCIKIVDTWYIWFWYCVGLYCPYCFYYYTVILLFICIVQSSGPVGIWINTMQCNAMQCNAMQCNAMQCNAMQCNTIQYNTIQYNTIQYWCPSPWDEYTKYVDLWYICKLKQCGRYATEANQLVVNMLELDLHAGIKQENQRH